MDLALAQRAVWIEDLALAIHGGKERQARVRELTQAYRTTITDPGLTEAQELQALQGLANDLNPHAGAALKKQLDFVAYCRKRGITW